MSSFSQVLLLTGSSSPGRFRRPNRHSCDGYDGLFRSEHLHREAAGPGRSRTVQVRGPRMADLSSRRGAVGGVRRRRPCRPRLHPTLHGDPYH